MILFRDKMATTAYWATKGMMSSMVVMEMILLMADWATIRLPKVVA